MVLNPDKSEVMVVGTSQRLSQSSMKDDVCVAGAVTTFSESMKIIGVTLDSKLNFDQHVSSICNACRFNIHALRPIRSVLDVSSATVMSPLLFQE